MTNEIKYQDLTKVDLTFVIEEYESLYYEIMDILFKINPIPFIQSEARDEYAPEARTLSVKIHFAENIEELEKIIKVDFEQWFDKELVGLFNKFPKLTNELFPLVNKQFVLNISKRISEVESL